MDCDQPIKEDLEKEHEEKKAQRQAKGRKKGVRKLVEAFMVGVLSVANTVVEGLHVGLASVPSVHSARRWVGNATAIGWPQLVQDPLGFSLYFSKEAQVD